MISGEQTVAVHEGERSINAVRWVLAFVGATLAIGSRAMEGGRSALIAIGIAGLVALIAAVMSWIPGWMAKIHVGPKLTVVVLQFLDIAASLGLVYVLSDLLPDAAWAVLTIPIVLASLRLNAVGVLWVWFISSLGYGALQQFDLVGRDNIPASTAEILERSAALLAVAAGVALLTRFLQAGWLEQAQLASEAEARLKSVQAIELAGREMRGRTPDEILMTCLHYVLDLGFEAATASAPNQPLRAVGNGDIVPADSVTEFLTVGVVELTEWNSPDGTIYSAAMIEQRSGTVISGWSLEPPGTLQAETLSELVAHASSGVELAGLMQQARYEADHDALTGLSNRARFDRKLREYTSKEQTVAMLFIDLDHFKRINDDHGHAMGDWALQQVSAILSELVDGLPARYGGDEFVAVLAGEKAMAAETLAVRLHEAVLAIATNRSVGEHKPIELSLSIGIAMAAGPVDPELLRRRADEAVFQAKADGRSTTSLAWLSPSSEPAAPLPDPVTGDTPLLPSSLRTAPSSALAAVMDDEAAPAGDVTLAPPLLADQPDTDPALPTPLG